MINENIMTGSRIVLATGLCLTLSGALALETAKTIERPPARPSTTLSAAANAASAAATAANAAADAASAAAAAAAAAVDAMNSILPASQRIAVPSAKPMPASSREAGNAKVAEPPVPATPILPPAESESMALTPTTELPKEPQVSDQKFVVPAERSLIGLVGTFEVPVSVDRSGDYAAGVLATNGDGADPVERIGALDLAQAVKASLGFSRDVLVASAKLDQAKAQTGQARAFLLPSLLVNVKTGRETSMPGSEIDPATGKEYTTSKHSRTDKSLTLKQPLFDAPNFYDWRRRDQLEKSKEASQRSSQGDAYLATVNAYLGLTSSRLLSNMATDYETQLDELLEYVQKRADAGAASNSDMERVRARSLNARSARIEQEAAHAAAGVEFARVVNLAPDSLRLPDMEDVGISIVPPTAAQAMATAVASNPDIQVLQSELEAADIDRMAARGRLLPRLDLEYSDNESQHPGGQAGSQRDKRLMLVMNWSLFNGGGDIKYGEEKAARRNEIRYRLDDQRRRVLQTLSAQYATLESTRQRITAGYKELESISTAAKAMSSRMLSGNQSLLDMLDVYDRFFQARTRLVSLHVQEIGAVAQIARLLQGPPKSGNEAPSLANAAGEPGVEGQ